LSQRDDTGHADPIASSDIYVIDGDAIDVRGGRNLSARPSATAPAKRTGPAAAAFASDKLYFQLVNRFLRFITNDDSLNDDTHSISRVGRPI